MKHPIRIPMVFTEKVTPKGARKDRDMHFFEWVDSELEEVTSDDAPVAFRWHDKHNRESIDGLCERRWHDGRLWMPQVYQYSGRPNVHVTLDELNGRLKIGSDYANPLIGRAVWMSEGVHGDLPSLDATELRAIFTDNRSTALEECQTRASEVIVIEGQIWIPGKEPAYEISSGWFRSEKYVLVNVIDCPETARLNKTVFRADRYEDAIDAATQINGGPLDEDSIKRIDVLLPDALGFDDEKPPIIQALRYCRESSTDTIGMKGRDTIYSWVEFREAVDLLDQDSSDEAVDAACRAAETYLAHPDASDYHLNDAIKRWDTRPIAALSSFSPR